MVASVDSLRSCSSTAIESIGQEVIKIWDGFYLVSGRIDIVFDATKFEVWWIKNNVTASPILIAGLPDTSDVDHRLGLDQLAFVVE